METIPAHLLQYLFSHRFLGLKDLSRCRRVSKFIRRATPPVELTRSLIDACINGDTALVTLLLERKTPLKWALDAKGRHVLLAASRKGHVHIVRILLTAGADVNLRSAKGSTALHFAVREGHLAVCKLLLSRGAMVEAKDVTLHTPLVEALQRPVETFSPIIKLLLEHGASPLTISADDACAIDFAAFCRFIPYLQLFLPYIPEDHPRREQIVEMLQREYDPNDSD